MVDEEGSFVVLLIGTSAFYQGCSISDCCYIDEVESLTAARAGAVSGTEPSDALRVRFTRVHRRRLSLDFPSVGGERPPNPARQAQTSKKCPCHDHIQPGQCNWYAIVRVFCASHSSPVRCAPDDAFVDRADIVQYVGLPPPEGIYWILQSCIQELTRTGIVAPVVSNYIPRKLFPPVSSSLSLDSPRPSPSIQLRH